MMSANNGYAKCRAVIGPDGTTYKGVRVASRATGIDPSKICRWIKTNLNGWKYVDAEPPKPQGRKKKEFEPMSVEDAIGWVELAPEQIAWLQNKLIHAQKSLLARIVRGEQVEGFEAKENQCRPYWLDTAKVVEFCKSIGLPEEHYVEKQLKAPAEVAAIINTLDGADLEFRKRYAERGCPTIDGLWARETNTALAKKEEAI